MTQPFTNSVRFTAFRLLLGLCLCFCGPMVAQVKFFTLVSEKELTSAQTFQLQYVVEGSTDIKQVKAPDLSNFRILEIFESNSTTVKPKTLELVDVYSKILVLSPLRSGQFTIGGASALIDGKKMHSNPVKVIVRSSGLSGLSNGEDNTEGVAIEETSELRPGESIDEKIKKNFFLKVEVNKRSCYVGDCLLVTYKVYSRLNASSQVLKRPSFTGFSVMEMVDAYDSRPGIERVNGIPYYVNLIRKVQLFPLQPGIFMLDPAEVESVIHFMKVEDGTGRNKDVKSLLDPSSGYISRVPYNHHLNLKTDPYPIQVKPLPKQNQPANYAGAIGQFSISTRVMSKEIRAGDLVKIRLLVEGTGNLPLLAAPRVDWPKGVDTADPQVIEEVNKYLYPLHGSKTFEYSFVAPDSGKYVIPAVQLPYYDPLARLYKVAITDSIVMHVQPGKNRDREEVSDDAAVTASNRPKQLYWFAVLALLIISWIIYQFAQLRRKPKPVDTKAGEGKASIDARVEMPADPLEAARRALDGQSNTIFYEELQRAIWQALAVKYLLPPSFLDKQRIIGILQNRLWPPDSIRSFETVLDECEWALYVPGHVPMDKKVLLQRAAELIEMIG